MFKAQTLQKRSIRTGIDKLDELVDIGNGIITLRCNDMEWLSKLVAGLIVRNHDPEKKILYLHWVDYYKRFWSINYDMILSAAKGLGVDADSVSKSLFFTRAFSISSVETDENWKRIFDFAKDVNFVILDSASDLYSDIPEHARKQRLKNQTYAIGMFSRLCLRNNCIGIVLDSYSNNLHPFLGSVSSIILDLYVKKGLMAGVAKHPCMEEKIVRISFWGQQDLSRWVHEV